MRHELWESDYRGGHSSSVVEVVRNPYGVKSSLIMVRVMYFNCRNPYHGRTIRCSSLWTQKNSVRRPLSSGSVEIHRSAVRVSPLCGQLTVRKFRPLWSEVRLRPMMSDIDFWVTLWMSIGSGIAFLPNTGPNTQYFFKNMNKYWVQYWILGGIGWSIG